MHSDSTTESVKVCFTCHETKPVSAFTKRRDRPSKYQATCKHCRFLKQKAKQEELAPKLSTPDASKPCARCKTSKPYSDFPRSNTTNDGFQHFCRICTAVLHTLYYERNKAKHPEPPIEKRCYRCKATKPRVEFTIDRSAHDGLDSLCRVCKAKLFASRQRSFSHSRAANIWYSYRLRVEDYNLLLNRQNGKCGICGKTLNKTVIDHDHATNSIRGILCAPCNQFLAQVEIPGMVEKARAYLELAEATGDLREIAKPFRKSRRRHAASVLAAEPEFAETLRLLDEKTRNPGDTFKPR